MHPEIGRREIVYQNKYQHIYRVSARFDGFTKEYFVNNYGQRVGLLLFRDDRVLLVRQYRFLINGLAWEIPGGRVDPGETPEDAAIREGLEETCLRCRNLKPLLFFHPGLDTFDNPTFLFSCDDFEEAPAQTLHQGEVTELVWVPFEKCIEMIFRREIVDSLTVLALLSYRMVKENPGLAQ